MGTLKRIEIVYLLLTVLFCNSCEDVDFSGFFHIPDPVNDRVKQSLEWNESHPSREISVNGTEYNLLVAGDSHVGGTVNLDAFINQANTTGISGMIMVGDLTTGHKEDYITFQQELDLKNSVPAFLMTGNHDLFFNGWKNFLEYFGSSTYSFKVFTNDATDLYICLDTGGGTLGWRQLAWLKNILEKERKNARFCILFTHVNFFRTYRTISTNPLVEELRVIIDLCYTNSIDMVIMGHDHKRGEEFLGKTRFITLDALADDNKGASYLKLQVKDNGLKYIFVEL